MKYFNIYTIIMFLWFGFLSLIGLGILCFLGSLAYIFPLQASIIAGSVLFLWIAYKFFGSKVRNIMGGIGLLIVIVLTLFYLIVVLFNVFTELLQGIAELLRTIADNIVIIFILIIISGLAYLIWKNSRK